MTAPKGSRQEQVQRLRIKAIEGMLADGLGPADSVQAFIALCASAESQANDLGALRTRIEALESLANASEVKHHDGTLKMG